MKLTTSCKIPFTTTILLLINDWDHVIFNSDRRSFIITDVGNRFLREGCFTIENAVLEKPLSANPVRDCLGIWKSNMISGKTTVINLKFWLVRNFVCCTEINHCDFSEAAERIAVFFVTPIGHVWPVDFEESLTGAFLVETEFLVLADELFLVPLGAGGNQFDVENEVAWFLVQGLFLGRETTLALFSLQSLGNLEVGTLLTLFLLDERFLGEERGGEEVVFFL